MGGVSHQKINGMPARQVAQVVQCAVAPCVASGQMATARTRRALIITIKRHNLGCGQVFDVGDAFGGVGHVFTGAKPHGCFSSKKRLESQYQREHRPVYTDIRILATVSATRPISLAKVILVA